MLNLPLAPLWAKLLLIPRPYLYAGILFFAGVGMYAVNASALDLLILLLLGALGFMMRRYGLPVIPLIIGSILGPMAELQLRRALQLSDGALAGLVASPLSIAIYVVIALMLLVPAGRALVAARRSRVAGRVGEEERVDR